MWKDRRPDSPQGIGKAVDGIRPFSLAGGMKPSIHLFYGIIIGVLICLGVTSCAGDQKEDWMDEWEKCTPEFVMKKFHRTRAWEDLKNETLIQKILLIGFCGYSFQGILEG